MSQQSVLRYHQIHGPDIRLYNNCTTARRVVPGSGLVFSSHPLKPYQKFVLKLSEVSDKNKEIINVGFTERHPSDDQQPTSCVKIVSLKKNNHIKNKTVYFYYTQEGKIHFGIDDQEKGCRDGKIMTRGPLWAFVHIATEETTIEVLNCHSFDWVSLNLVPMMVHQSRGRNVKLVKNTICKYDRRLDVSYAFSEDPIKIGQHVVVKILDVDCRSRGGITFGLISSNPSHLAQNELPDNVGSFLTKPGYSLLVSDSSWYFKQNDRISFMITSDEKMRIWRNESTILKEVPLNVSSELWAFFEIAALESVEVLTYLSTDSGLEKSKVSDWKEVRNETVISTRRISDEDDSSSCVVCCEKTVEAALYPCGHMCMCYGCAKEQWRGAGHGCCPMCRVKIKDVLKIYKI